MSSEAKMPSTKDKLASIVHGFDSFDSEMKVGTRQRREKDEYKIAELKNEMKRLDVDLVAEIKRRTEMNKSTQAWFEEQLSELNQEFNEVLTERHEQTNLKLEHLSTRVDEVEATFAKDKEAILQHIDERGQELANMLNKFKEEFELDRVQRLERESHIVKQLTDHEHEVGEKFEKQIQSRESRYVSLKALLEDNIKLRNKAEERFQSYFDREINIIKNDLIQEKETRETEDDEIVEALNRYTIKLQNSILQSGPLLILLFIEGVYFFRVSETHASYFSSSSACHNHIKYHINQILTFRMTARTATKSDTLRFQRVECQLFGTATLSWW
eukprot:gene10079-21004_t